jgi:plastocyanin
MIVGFALAVVGCDDDDPTGPEKGAIEVQVTTSGDEVDANGYFVDLDDGLATEPVEVNGTVDWEIMDVGNHTVELQDIADNCTVDGDNPRTVTVEVGVTETVTFSVTCEAAG